MTNVVIKTTESAENMLCLGFPARCVLMWTHPLAPSKREGEANRQFQAQGRSQDLHHPRCIVDPRRDFQPLARQNVKTGFADLRLVLQRTVTQPPPAVTLSSRGARASKERATGPAAATS